MSPDFKVNRPIKKKYDRANVLLFKKGKKFSYANIQVTPHYQVVANAISH